MRPVAIGLAAGTVLTLVNQVQAFVAGQVEAIDVVKAVATYVVVLLLAITADRLFTSTSSQD